MTTQLTIKHPDDWHLHLRDGDMLKGVIAHSAAHFARAIIMPNLVPPVITHADAIAYRERIMKALPDGMSFEPLEALPCRRHHKLPVRREGLFQSPGCS